jgi:hypothetical protein
MSKLSDEAKAATQRVEETVSRMCDLAAGSQPSRTFLDHYITVRQSMRGTIVAIVVSILTMYVTR